MQDGVLSGIVKKLSKIHQKTKKIHEKSKIFLNILVWFTFVK
jgi:hypothetical protein